MKKPLLITTGEPAGIGMDIVLLLADQGRLEQVIAKTGQSILVLANFEAWQQRAKMLVAVKALRDMPKFNVIALGDLTNLLNNQLSNIYQKTALYLIDMPIAESVVAGELNNANGSMVLAQLQLAHELAINQQISAIVTAPLQKSVIMREQPDFMGHTEFFMAKSGLDKVVMMLANHRMKVVLVTTHLPLRAVADAISMTAVADTINIVLTDFKQKFGIAMPKILVCGLNPHAGENGYLGREEIEIINPVLTNFQQQGINISLAMPADTLFTPKYLDDCDVVIAMYHDQGLAPLKSHGFGETVNITLGLPYVRTSVDHGTALDLAGTGRASCESLAQAIHYACQMSS
ncbi:4-hydroxythreonine-4-phosphate dehydrogenase [Moraxella macacae 0408225]|uniref:4-hydroxythreonine-4-phosphate dehydrogenase n=1 Tax=Moraxella macacae 0408225 TaxID=1230338 RepID=L2F6L6_9GAMM|nr:4-hydroxythreonine-4-phosphate dehydrogenase PdxA [Moraxella macacae]ELA08682.1 4-hydroxythreonine-4-phosphate dehydrogenase [Moraxella macacae 0408225]